MALMAALDPLPEVKPNREEEQEFEEALQRLNRFFPDALCRELIIAEYDKVSPKNLAEFIASIQEILWILIFVFLFRYLPGEGSCSNSNMGDDLYDIECSSFRYAYFDWWAGIIWRYSTDSAWPEKRLDKYLLPEPPVGYSVHPLYYEFESQILPKESVMKLGQEFAVNIMTEVNNHPNGLVIFTSADNNLKIRIRKDARGCYLDLGL